MEILLLVHNLLLLAFFMLVLITVTTSFSDFEASDEPDDPSSICKYERFAEVERECSPVLSLASKAKLGNDRIYGIARDLSFQNGDWVQDAGGAPLMPFDDSDMPKNFSGVGSPLQLASFWVIGFDFAHQTDTAVGLCGLMDIGITRNRSLPYMPRRWSPWFDTRPGYSDQTILFEGLYVESEENEGERLMCLLGTSLFPFSEGFVDFYERAMHRSCEKNHQPTFIKDDRIMLVLRYPKNFTLTSRSVLGAMRSLNQKSDSKYFDKVHISSQLGSESKYMFAAEQLVSNACKPYPYQDEMIDDGMEIFKGSQFCKVLQTFASEMFDIAAVSKCDGMRKHCNNFGPFKLGREIGKFRLIMTNLLCVPGNDLNKLKTAKVSAVFRVVSPLEDRYTSEARTGLSGTTISAEGFWNSSSGQLCMVGCVGVETDSDGCDSRICLYLPTTFSITRRSILFGTISSIKKIDSYSPLLFKKELRPLDLWNRYTEYSKSYLSYKYSKIELANALLKRDQNFDLLGALMMKLFKYAAVEDGNNITGLSLLSDELSFHVNALPHPLSKNHPSKTIIEMVILSFGPLFGRYWPGLKDHFCERKDAKFCTNSSSAEHKLPLNVSAHLSLTGEYYSHISELFLEGLYNPYEGKMYLIGCRDVPQSVKFSYDKFNLESNTDCLIEVKIEYSSKTTRWLINPTAKVSIASQRNKRSPLYFSPISLSTVLIPYANNSREIIFREKFEVIFRILVLLASIACVLSQLFYVKKKVDAIPFMSLAMLGIQVFGCGLPLIMNTAILFKWKEYQYPQGQALLIGKSTQFRMLNCAMKFLLLVALVVTLRLFQKVRESRRFPAKHQTLKQNPSEKRVFLVTFMIYLVGFIVVLITRNTDARDTYQDLPKWVTELDKYTGLLQDFFLLPQIMGNMLWQIQVKPLGKVYYIGFTALRLLLRGYDYVREPVFSTYDHKYDSTTSSEFFSKFDGIMIMTIVAALAIIVHAQQIM